MPNRARSGMEVSELTVVVVVAGLLAAMLLPAFAREQGRARQAVCLANLRMIAQALRMYLTDNDGTLPPVEYAPTVLAYFNTHPGGGGKDQWDPAQIPNCPRAKQSNPYLRWPVILDDYLLTREVWRCPDARLEGGASFINGASDWLAHLQANEDRWGRFTPDHLCPRALSFPGGWGGEVTDTLAQGRLALPRSDRGLKASPGMFLWSVATNEIAVETNAYKHGDPAWFVVVADGGGSLGAFCTGTLAYPDLCHLECASAVPIDLGHWQADWENCPWSRECGAIAAMKLDVSLRRRYARHHGGVNLGFLDGHVMWFDSEEVIALSPTLANPQRGRLRGYHPWGPTKDAPRDDGIPPLY